MGDGEITEFAKGDGEIALPGGVGGVGVGEALSDGESGGEKAGGLGEVALGDGEITEFVEGDGEIALPGGVGRVGVGKWLDDGQKTLFHVRKAGIIAQSPIALCGAF